MMLLARLLSDPILASRTAIACLFSLSTQDAVRFFRHNHYVSAAKRCFGLHPCTPDALVLLNARPLDSDALDRMAILQLTAKAAAVSVGRSVDDAHASPRVLTRLLAVTQHLGPWQPTVMRGDFRYTQEDEATTQISFDGRTFSPRRPALIRAWDQWRSTHLNFGLFSLQGLLNRADSHGLCRRSLEMIGALFYALFPFELVRNFAMCAFDNLELSLNAPRRQPESMAWSTAFPELRAEWEGQGNVGSRY